MRRWIGSALVLCLAAGCEFGGGGGGVPGGELGPGAATTGAGASGTVGALTGIPTGAVGGGDSDAGVSSDGADGADEPATGPGDATGETTNATSSTSGDGASSSSTTADASSSSSGDPVENPYEDCMGGLTACNNGQGACFDSGELSVCVPFCVGGMCPMPVSGQVTPSCDDFSVVLFEVPVCGLPCTETRQCPDGMQCETLGLLDISRCVWPQ